METVIIFIPIRKYPFHFSPSALVLLDFVDTETGLVVSCMASFDQYIKYL